MDEDVFARRFRRRLASDLLGLLAERGRTDYLGAIDEKYEGLLDADLGRARVQVRTAVAVTGGQREMPALGGFIAESGSVVVDGSLEGRLERMRRRLASG
jgi:F0F1-type ATP synthase delta subunit